jgi:hypothetical protein
MKPPLDPPDPLLQSLVEDIKEFPEVAAAQARSQVRSRIFIRGVLTLSGLILVATIWFSQRTTSSSMRVQKVPTSSPAKPTEVSAPGAQGFVHIYRPTEQKMPEGWSAGATEREKELLRELQDVPVLIVKNQRGEVSRVQIFERQ